MTREEAIERLEDTFEAWDIWVKKCPEDAPARLLNEALGMAISALREQPRWISVEEAMPKDQCDVLVVALWNGEWQTMTGWISCVTDKWRCVTPYGEHEPEKVTHWMPLPYPEVEV